MTTTQKKDVVRKKTALMEDDAQPAVKPESVAAVIREPAITSASVAQAPQSDPIKPQPKLTPNRLKSAEYTVLRYHVVPEAAVTLEQVQNKTFFTHCANKLKPGNEITVEAEDGSYWAWLLVRSVTGPEVVTETLLAKQFNKIERGSIIVGDYFTQWGGTHDKWRVMRKSASDQVPVIISSGHDTEIKAVSWITEHQKALAA